MYRTVNVLTIHAAFVDEVFAKQKGDAWSDMLHKIPDTSKVFKTYIQCVARLNITSLVCVRVLLSMSVHFYLYGHCLMHTANSSLLSLWAYPEDPFWNYSWLFTSRLHTLQIEHLCSDSYHPSLC